MKFKPGKEYRTRGGLKARLYADDGCGIAPYHGAILGLVGWAPISWDEDGVAHGYYAGDCNLMPEKNLIAGWLWVFKTGEVRFHDFPPRLPDPCLAAAKRISIEYTEGEFDD